MGKIMAADLAEFNKANKRGTVTVGGRLGEMLEFREDGQWEARKIVSFRPSLAILVVH